MKDDKKALVLFSGGKDSLIVTLRLLDSNYKVYLVTYENGCGLKTENVNNTIERLVKKYGTEKIENIGIKNISGFFREFIYPFYNYTSSYIKENYGDITKYIDDSGNQYCVIGTILKMFLMELGEASYLR